MVPGTPPPGCRRVIGGPPSARLHRIAVHGVPSRASPPLFTTPARLRERPTSAILHAPGLAGGERDELPAADFRAGAPRRRWRRLPGRRWRRGWRARPAESLAAFRPQLRGVPDGAGHFESGRPSGEGASNGAATPSGGSERSTGRFRRGLSAGSQPQASRPAWLLDTGAGRALGGPRPTPGATPRGSTAVARGDCRAAASALTGRALRRCATTPTPRSPIAAPTREGYTPGAPRRLSERSAHDASRSLLAPIEWTRRINAVRPARGAGIRIRPGGRNAQRLPSRQRFTPRLMEQRTSGGPYTCGLGLPATPRTHLPRKAAGRQLRGRVVQVARPAAPGHSDGRSIDLGPLRRHAAAEAGVEFTILGGAIAG
jgi:hypothetical protein